MENALECLLSGWNELKDEAEKRILELRGKEQLSVQEEKEIGRLLKKLEEIEKESTEVTKGIIYERLRNLKSI